MSIHLTSCNSCNIGEGGIALAEAVHGSAPDIAGKVGDHSYMIFIVLIVDDYEICINNTAWGHIYQTVIHTDFC